MDIIDELNRLASDDERYNLINEYMANGGKLTYAILALVGLEKNREKLAITFVKNGELIDSSILSLIESQGVKKELVERHIANGGKIDWYMLRQIESQDVRKELIEKHIESGNNISADFLSFRINSQKVRKELIEKCIESGREISNDLLYQIESQDVRKELIEKYIARGQKINGDMLYTITSHQEQEDLLMKYVKKGGLLDFDLLIAVESPTVLKDLLEKHIANGGTIDDYTLRRIDSQDVREELVFGHIKNGGKIDSKILELIDSPKATDEIALAYINKGGRIDNSYTLGLIDEVRDKVMLGHIKNGGKITEPRMLALIVSQDVREELVFGHIKNGGEIDKRILELVKSQDAREEILDMYIENGGTIDGYTIELIYSQKAREKILIGHIKNGGKITDIHMLISIESQDVRKELLKGHIENGGEFTVHMLKKVFLQQAREEILKQYAKAGKHVSSNMLLEIESQQARKEILEIYIENGGEIISDTVATIESEEMKKDLFKKHIAYGGKIVEPLLMQLYLPEYRIEILEEYLKKKNEENSQDEKYEKCKSMLGTLSRLELSIEKAQNEQRKNELLEKRDMMYAIIIGISLSSESRHGFSLEYDEEGYKKVMAWGEKGVIPPSYAVFDNLPLENIDEFNIKIWNRLNKAVDVMSYETETALLEMSYVFGLYKQDVRVSRGNVAENGEDNQERMNKVMAYISSLEYKSQLHEIFDGMGMEFKPKFYQFFFDNIEAIKENRGLGQDETGTIRLGNLQRELRNIYANIEKIEEEYGTGTPTLEQCRLWLIQRQKELQKVGYENIEEGNRELAILCGLAGVSQKNFEEYQMLYEKSKTRGTSSIPRIRTEKRREEIGEIEGKKIGVERNREGNDKLTVEDEEGRNISFEILKMDNPRGAVCGERIFSRCCQSLGGAGEECMRHSQESRNGGILEIRTADGTYIGQSWCWVNGNVLCFDSPELKALDENPNMTSSEKKEYLRLVKIGYEQMAKRMIEESNKKVEEYVRRKKEEARTKYGEESEEYREAEKEIEEKGDRIKIKQVTIGRGFWEISQKLSEMFEEEGRRIEGDRKGGQLASPIERIGYIDDSQIQYELARAEEVKREEIRTVRDGEEQEAIYTDRRSIIEESGRRIRRDTLAKIKEIEEAAHKESMQMMGRIDTAYGESPEEKLARLYETEAERLRVKVGEDWYYIYSIEEDSIVIHDAARMPRARLEGEEGVSQTELVEGFYEIMGESVESGKKMKAQLRGDTSYPLYKKMLEKGQLEQIGEERVYEFEEEMGIRVEKGEKGTTMHEIECQVTDRGKKMIERMRRRQENDSRENV